MANSRGPNQRLSGDSDSGTDSVQTFQRAALYILGEKAQMKVSVIKNFYFELVECAMLIRQKKLFVGHESRIKSKD